MQIRKGAWPDARLTFLLALNVVTILFWDTVEFNPGNTVNTHASYAMILIAFIIACIILYQFSPRCAWAVCLANVTLSVMIWVILAPGPFWPPQPHLSWIPLAVALAGAAAIVHVLRLQLVLPVDDMPSS